MVRGDEILRVLLVVGAVGVLYFAAAVVLLRRIFVRPRPPTRWPARVVLGLAALGVLCTAYACLVEPRWPEVTTTRVPTPRLPPGHRGVRIVHLSDIHSEPSPLLEERLPAVVAPLRPDLIVFTGDCANSPEGVPVFRKCLTEIAKIAPTFVVKGNWDTGHFPEVDRFSGTGATELDGASADVSVDGATVHLVGAPFASEWKLERPLRAVPPTGPCVVLYHCPYPDVLPPDLAARVDLMCAGHVHGGQVAVPFYGAVLTLSKWGKTYERGLYPLPSGGFMYVSRGIGMEGFGLPRMRFCARPEIASIELVPSAAAR